MDRDQQLNVYYTDPVAIVDRFIMDRFTCQPRFAGQTYMKFERQELKQRIRQESSPAHRHAQSPMASFYSVLTNRSQSCIELRIQCTMRIATVCNILQ